MKNILIKFTAILTSMLCVLASVDFNAFAYEMEKTFTVNFKLVNPCGYEGDNLSVRLDDIGSDLSETFEINWSNPNEAQSYVIDAPTTYTITIENLKDGYVIYDYQTCEPYDDKFAATNNGEITFTWEILNKDEVNEPQVATESSDSDNKVSGDSSSFTVKMGDNIYDAEDVYNKFITLYEKYYYDEEEWKNCEIEWKSNFAFFNAGIKKDKYDENTEHYFTSVYAKVRKHDGMTENELKAEFEAMTSYEMSVWVLSYLGIVEPLCDGKYDAVSNVLNGGTGGGNAYLYINRAIEVFSKYDKHDDLKDAYEDLLYWDKHYFEEFGVPYNFIDKCSYSESIGLNAPDSATKADDTEEVKSDEEELEDIKDEIMAEMTDEEKKEVEDAVKEIEDDTDDSEKGNVAPIIIAVIVILLIGAGAFVFIKKKTKND